jgi:Chlorophyll A-B binding protein
MLSKLSTTTLLTGSATAFAPSKDRCETAVARMAFEEEIGAQAPLGLFDPLGLVKDGDEEKFSRLRYVELKHGRISMLAVLGHIVTSSGTRLPGDIDYSGTSFESIPSGLGALTSIPVTGLAQIFLFIGLLELSVMKDVTGDGEFVGDFRNGALDFGWDTFSFEEQERKRGIELNNG